jgi:hypothetical protein
MESLLRSLGWILVRVLIALLAGFGVGLFLIGQAGIKDPEAYSRYLPPPGVYDGIGAGLLTGGGMLLLLFLPGWLSRKPLDQDSSKFTRLFNLLCDGVVKLLICALAAGGVACLYIGWQVSTNPELFKTYDVSPPILTGTGAGLVVGAVMLVLLFVLPWIFRGPRETPPAVPG